MENHSIQNNLPGVNPPQTIDQLMQENGIPLKGNPFLAFIFLITYVMAGQEAQNKEDNIAKFANNVSSMSDFIKLWNQLKTDFNNAASGDDNTQTVKDAANLINQVFGNYMKASGIAPFPTDGSRLSFTTLNSIFSGVKNLSPDDLNKYFPALGSNVLGVISSLQDAGSSTPGQQENIQNGNCPLYFFFTDANGSPTFNQLWQYANQGSDPGTGSGDLPLPNTGELQLVTNGFSDVSSTFSGIGGGESTQLQLAEQDYSRLQGFVKQMLQDWTSQRKAFITAMSQAGN